MSATHTYAVLEVSSEAYYEIKRALEKAGYSGQFRVVGTKTRMRVCQPDAARAERAGPGACYPGGQHCNRYCMQESVKHPKDWQEDAYVIDMHGLAIQEKP